MTVVVLAFLPGLLAAATPAATEAIVALALAGVVAAALVAQAGVLALVRRSATRSSVALGGQLLGRLRMPVRWTLPLAALEIALGLLPFTAVWVGPVAHAVGIALIAAVAWLIVRLTYVLEDVVVDRYRAAVDDDLRMRRMQTQIRVLRKITVVVVAVVAVALALLTFAQVRAVGASLLASAGLVGLVAGLAARPTVTNLVAGAQLAITQPIRLEDVVVVDGQWGRIEEITLTYVVVRVWDLRRLVLPISYFTSTPFENWTRSSTNLIGAVHLEVDYTTPVERVRAELERIVAATPRWDGKTWNLQVTQAGTQTLQLRALISAADSPTLWDLRCEVREHLVAFLQRELPECLPRVRAEVLHEEAADGDAEEQVQGTDAEPGHGGPNALLGVESGRLRAP